MKVNAIRFGQPVMPEIGTSNTAMIQVGEPEVKHVWFFNGGQQNIADSVFDQAQREGFQPEVTIMSRGAGNAIVDYAEECKGFRIHDLRS